MSENHKSRRETSAEITLELVAQTAFELHKLFPNSAPIHGDVLANRGREAIEYLSIWARQLEIEKRTGAAAKRAEELLNRWQAESEEYDRSREKIGRESRQRVDWAAISRTRQIPFAPAAKLILPKKRDAIVWLERILTILSEEKSPLPRALIDICRKALRNKSVPEGLIPYLEGSRDLALRTYRSRTAKKSGQKGGMRRAQKYSKNKTAAENSI